MSTDQTRDFLLFRVQGQTFALPAQAIAEAVAPRAVTPLPFVPDYIEGLVNVGERVLPQIRLQRLLFPGTETAAEDNDELLVIETTRSPCALRVDRIVGRVVIQADDIQPIQNADGELAASTLFDGQFDHEGDAVLVIDATRLGTLIVSRETPAGRRGMLGRLEQDDEEQRFHELPCVVVRVGNERYALPLDDALEILDIGPATPVPGTPPAIEGIAIVRDEVLLVLSLPQLLGRGCNQDGARHVLVIERDDTRYGIRVDAVDGIIPFNPDTLRRIEDDSGEVAGVLVHDDQVYGLLAPERLVTDARHLAYKPFVPDTRRHQTQAAIETRAVLQIALGDEDYALPLDLVRRIAGYTPPERIEHDAGALVSAAVNIDGNIVPVVDLARHLHVPVQGDASAWVVVGNDRGEWAIPVTEAHRILDIPVNAIEDVERREQGFVTAVASVEDRLVSLLSLAPLMDQTAHATDARTRVGA